MDHKLGNKGNGYLQILQIPSSKRKNVVATVSYICQLWPGARVGQGCSSFSCFQIPGRWALSLLRVFSFAHNRKQSTSSHLCFLYLFQDETMIRASQEFVVPWVFHQVRLLVREPRHCSWLHWISQTIGVYSSLSPPGLCATHSLTVCCTSQKLLWWVVFKNYKQEKNLGQF